MIDRTHKLSIARQAEALGISRGAVYYVPRAMSDFDLALMRRIDAVHLEMPWFGARGLKRVFQSEFPGVGRRRIATLMQTMGISAVAPQPGTSKRHRAHPVYPYLLRHRTITRPNEVWAMDITYIPMARGFVHFTAVDGLRVLPHSVARVSVCWRSTAPSPASPRWRGDREIHGCPETFNTRPGRAITECRLHRAVPHTYGIAISMDG